MVWLFPFQKHGHLTTFYIRNNTVFLKNMSELALASRVHNPDQQGYEFWVIDVIPSSFRFSSGDT